MKLLILAALAGSLIAGSAAAQQHEGKCFFTRDLRNHTVGDAHTLYFDVNGRSVYRVDMSNSCLAGATSSDPIVMVNRGGGSQICTKMDLDIKVRGSGCIVSNITKLTPAEIEALPKHVRP